MAHGTKFNFDFKKTWGGAIKMDSRFNVNSTCRGAINKQLGSAESP